MANTVRHLKTTKHPKDDRLGVYIMKVTVLDTVDTDITILTPGGTVTNIDGTTPVSTGRSNQVWKLHKIMVANDTNAVIRVKSGATTLFEFPPSTSIMGEDAGDVFPLLEGLSAGQALVIQSSVADVEVLLYVSTLDS
jgi:hypothetical protein